MKENILCKILGHKWRYAFLSGPHKDIRCCDRCHTFQDWQTSFLDRKTKYWSLTVTYREKGAKKHVEGYGEA
jgi:hypothetical protein